MCAQKSLVLALYGASCAGKSEVAKAMAKRLGCDVRSAGAAIRARCLELNVPTNALPLDEHRNIDTITHDMAGLSSGCLVLEGTFLDVLLSDLDHVLKIELICEDLERRERFKTREGKDALQQRDDADRRLRENLHGHHVGISDIAIDTTSRAAEQVAEEIIQWAQRRNRHD